jgi:hypothetical protein
MKFVLSGWTRALTTAMLPEMATLLAKLSPATVSDPFSIASRVPTGGAARGLAVTAEAVLARSGRTIPPTATRLAMRDVRM